MRPVKNPRPRQFVSLLVVALSFCIIARASPAQSIIVGSRPAPEDGLLGEVATRTLAEAGFRVEHKQGIGRAQLLWAAIRSGQLTCYPEYTFVVAEHLLKLNGGVTAGRMQKLLAEQGIGMTGELGFNNASALVMRSDRAKRLGIRTIGDLKHHPELRVVGTHLFLERRDGWRPLAALYGLTNRSVVGVEQSLCYVSLQNGQADVMEAFSTDGKLSPDQFTILEDDLHFFPMYKGVFLYRLDAPVSPAHRRTIPPPFTAL